MMDFAGSAGLNSLETLPAAGIDQPISAPGLFSFCLPYLLYDYFEYCVAYLSINSRIILWYLVLCCWAWRLKNSMLDLLSDMVIFSVSSGTANSAGGGRKSFILVNFPIGISELLFLAFIVIFSLSPISGSDNPDLISAISKSDSQNLTFDYS